MTAPETPKWHHNMGMELLTCIGANKDNPEFDSQQASALAQAAQAQALLGLLKFLVDLDPYTFLKS